MSTAINKFEPSLWNLLCGRSSVMNITSAELHEIRFIYLFFFLSIATNLDQISLVKLKFLPGIVLGL